MPAVTRKGDVCTGHSCFPSRPSVQGEPRFIVSGREAHLQSHAWASHCCGPPCHGSVLAAGSARFTVKGLQLGRIGDPVACGSAVATGEPRFTVAD